MSVADNYQPVVVAGTATEISFSWIIPTSEWLVVEKNLLSTGARTTLTQGSDYTVVLSSSGGIITITSPVGALYEYIASMNVPMTQETPYSTSQGFQGKVIENSFDKLTRITQELSDGLDRSLKFKVGSSNIDTEFPDIQANKIVLTNSAGDGFTFSEDNFTDIQTDLATCADNISSIIAAPAAATTATTQAGIATAAAAAAQVAKIEWKGTYSGATAYAVNDAVTYNGSSFICKLASTGNAPNIGGNTWWDDLAQKGETFSNADIVNQATETITSSDLMVWADVSDSNNLKKSTVQGITDTLFSGSTVTPTGAELVAFDDGTNATAQSIADLAGGGGLSATLQTLQASTSVQYSDLSYCNTFQLADGKILEVKNTSITTINVRIISTETDGTVTLGTSATITDGTDTLGAYNLVTKVAILNSTQLILTYANDTDSLGKAVLVTYDTSANTVSLGTPVNLNSAASTGFNAGGCDIKRIDDSTAVCVYTGDTSANTYLYGRVLTVSSGVLTANTQYTILASSAYQLNAYLNLYYSSFHSRWCLYCVNNDTTWGILAVSFTVSGTVIASDTTNITKTVNFYPTPVGTSDFLYLKVFEEDDELIFIYYNGITHDLRKCKVNPNYIKGGGSYTYYPLVAALAYRYEEEALGGYGEHFTTYAESDNYIFATGVQNNESLRLYTFTKGDAISRMISRIPEYSGSYYLTCGNICKIRDNQFMLTYLEGTTLYLYYQPFTIEE